MNAELFTSDVSARLEAILFSEGSAISIQRLLKLLDCTKEELANASAILKQKLEGRGVSLLASGAEMALAVAPLVAHDIDETYLKELDRDIGDAGLEVLSIVLYRGPSTRATIDYIRGVNSTWTIRTLLSRGLLERNGNPDDAREYVYRGTIELMAHLGATDIHQLPAHDTISAELALFESQKPSHAESTEPALCEPIDE